MAAQTPQVVQSEFVSTHTGISDKPITQQEYLLGWGLLVIDQPPQLDEFYQVVLLNSLLFQTDHLCPIPHLYFPQLDDPVAESLAGYVESFRKGIVQLYDLVHDLLATL